MSQYGWADCPEDSRAQVQGFLDRLYEILGDDLVGVYLHGSLAMGCFNPMRSDIDLLIVTGHRMSLETKRELVQELSRRSLAPRPIEISFLTLEDVRVFQYPMPFDLHYGEDWREQYQQELANGAWLHWNDTIRVDSDLAAHITVTLRRGICLYGELAQTVLPPVPPQDYANSIVGDFYDANEHMTNNVVYFVLNACRVYAYLLEGTILSKDEGGTWGMQHVPEGMQDVVAHALALYRGNENTQHFNGKALALFARYMEEKIKSSTA